MLPSELQHLVLPSELQHLVLPFVVLLLELPSVVPLLVLPSVALRLALEPSSPLREPWRLRRPLPLLLLVEHFQLHPVLLSVVVQYRRLLLLPSALQHLVLLSERLPVLLFVVPLLVPPSVVLLLALLSVVPPLVLPSEPLRLLVLPSVAPLLALPSEPLRLSELPLVLLFQLPLVQASPLREP